MIAPALRLSPALFCLCLGLLSLPAKAERPGFDVNAEAPVEIEAEALEVDQTQKNAIFSGSVRVRQDRLRLLADRIEVVYEEKETESPRTSLPGGAEITSLNASGHVRVIAGDDESAQGNWGHYDVPKRLITLKGGVILRQGGHVLTGETLLIDLNAGLSRLEGGVQKTGSEKNEGKRVRGLFRTQPQNSKNP